MSEAEVATPWVNSMPEGRVVKLDYEMVSPFEFLKRRAETDSNKPCMILPKGKTLTFGQVYSNVLKIASKMQSMGVEKGDRIALMYNNVPHYTMVHFACLAIGAVVVQVNPLYTEHELRHIVTDSGAKGLFTLTLFQEKSNKVLDTTDMEFVVYAQIREYLSPVVKFLGSLLRKSIFDPNGPTFDAPKADHPGTYAFKEFLAGSGNVTLAEIDVENDLAVFQYTGGTTGFPKGAMLTHKNLSVNVQQARAVIHMVPDGEGANMGILPMFHIFGLTVVMNLSIMMGIPMILNIASPPDFNDVLSWIEKYKVSFLPGVPRVFIALNSHPKAKGTDFSSVVAAISGGAPLPLEVAKGFYDVTNAHLVEGYGLSETSPLTHVNPIGGVPREGSIGLPAPDTFCKVVDVNDYSKTLPIGEVGEICVKGPQVFKGYYNMQDETSNVLLDDGWFKTGDIGKMDEDGYAYIVDRKKDMIIVSGYNVYPRDVEEVLFMHPKVQEAAVAGLTDETRGEIVAAWLVLKEGETATVEEIIEHCKEYLAPYKVPKEVTFRDELPTTIVGKVLRRKLQEEEEAEAE